LPLESLNNWISKFISDLPDDLTKIPMPNALDLIIDPVIKHCPTTINELFAEDLSTIKINIDQILIDEDLSTIKINIDQILIDEDTISNLLDLIEMNIDELYSIDECSYDYIMKI
jgi:hypothetical protein